jgi:uncharacterized cupredoxin-like copper-binding protein|tara:strand:+ start:808 stop:1032 length:225 start_codon:yes stop_codon:yes gene_type:complete
MDSARRMGAAARLGCACSRQAGKMYDHANSVLLKPGQTARVTWTFGEKSELGFACNVPGHRAAGMVGDITFARH